MLALIFSSALPASMGDGGEGRLMRIVRSLRRATSLRRRSCAMVRLCCCAVASRSAALRKG